MLDAGVEVVVVDKTSDGMVWMAGIGTTQQKGKRLSQSDRVPAANGQKTSAVGSSEGDDLRERNEVVVDRKTSRRQG